MKHIKAYMMAQSYSWLTEMAENDIFEHSKCWNNSFESVSWKANYGSYSWAEDIFQSQTHD